MRCRKCDKSQHVHCLRGKCECKCRSFYDNKEAGSLDKLAGKEEEPIVPKATLDNWDKQLETARNVFGLKKNTNDLGGSA